MFLPRTAFCISASSCAVALCCTMVLPAAAQQVPQQQVIAHRITAGDTLTQIAQHYLGDATLWQALQSHNKVGSPYRLQPGSMLEVPMWLMRKATASVGFVQGNAQLRNRSATAAVPVQPGMPLEEGDQLQLSPDAFVTVKLADGSLIQVRAASSVQLSQLRRRGRAGSLQSVLELQKGGVDVQVPGKPDARRHLDIRTPVAATSVRGTRFDVQLQPDGSTTAAVLQGQVAMQSLTGAQSAVQTLPPHFGMAVAANGQPGPVTALLPAPSAQSLPSLYEDAQWLDIPLPAMPQAQGWLVGISSDAQGHKVLRNAQVQGQQARFAALPDGSYYLHVRALDLYGISGLPRTVPIRVKAHPVPPLVQTPAPGGTLAMGEAQLLCTPVDGVDSYRHQIIALPAADADIAASAFAQPVLQDNSPAQDCRIDLKRLPAGDYAWRAASVRSMAGQPDRGPFAEPHRFRIAPRPAAPSAEDLQEHTVAGLSTIHWPGEPGQRYRLQAFATPDGTAPALDTLLDSPRWTAAGLPTGTWHVRIQVQDPSGLSSAFSPPRSVQVRDLLLDGTGQPVQSGTGLGIERWDR